MGLDPGVRVRSANHEVAGAEALVGQIEARDVARGYALQPQQQCGRAGEVLAVAALLLEQELRDRLVRPKPTDLERVAALVPDPAERPLRAFAIAPTLAGQPRRQRFEPRIEILWRLQAGRALFTFALNNTPVSILNFYLKET